MATDENTLREKLTEALTESILNTDDGAGSGLEDAYWDGRSEWIEVRGDLDIQHVVSEVLIVLQNERLIPNPRPMTSEEYLASYGDTDLEV